MGARYARPLRYLGILIFFGFHVFTILNFDFVKKIWKKGEGKIHCFKDHSLLNQIVNLYNVVLQGHSVPW